MAESISSIYNQQSYNVSEGTTTKKSVVGKDEFLKLLTFQLKAQNPLKPYDNQEFAAQLAQFSQLEQLTDIRSLIEEQVKANMILSQTMSNAALPGLLGKTAKALSNQVKFDGENSIKLGYTLPTYAFSGEVIIKNEAGVVVRNIPLSDNYLRNGEHIINWDGRDNEGNVLDEGKYTFSVVARDRNGSSYSVDTYSIGAIESIRFKNEGTVLVINGVEVSLQNVVDISMG